MGGKDLGFGIVYRGETATFPIEGKYVFFQRLKEHGGGFWFGQVYNDCFVFALERPIAIREGMDYLATISKVEAMGYTFHDDVDDFYLKS